MTIRRRLARSNLVMILIPVAIAAVLLLLGGGLALLLLERVWLPRLGLSFAALHETGEQLETAFAGARCLAGRERVCPAHEPTLRRVSDDLARQRVASSDARACRLSYMDSPVRPQAAKTFVCTLESYLRSYGIRLVGVRLRGATVGRRGPDVRKLRRRNRLTVGRAVDRMVDVDGRMRSLRLRAWIVWRSDCLALTGGYGLRRIGRLAVWVKGARGGCFRTKQ